METVEKALREVENIYAKYVDEGLVAEFTSKVVEDTMYKIADCREGKVKESWDKYHSILAYDIHEIMEICDTKKLDYKILNKLYEIVK